MSEISQDATFPVFDISGSEPVKGSLPHDEVHEALASGKFSPLKGTEVPVLSPEGEFGHLPSEEVQSALQNGYQYATPKMAKEAKYGTTGQMIKTGLEGIAKGVAGPLAPLVETGLGIATPEDIRAREETNPITSGVGQAVGLGAGLLTGTGEAALMTKAGEIAEAAAGLGQASRLAKIGSSAVRNAAEMAVLQSGDEVAKTILKDPEVSAQSAIANVGLASLAGGATGAFITGAIHPLWEATGGPKLTKALNDIVTHMNGGAKPLASEIETASKDLGVQIPDILRGANTTELGNKSYSHLKRMENKQLLETEQKFNKDISDSIVKSTGVNPEDVTHYSSAEHGNEIKDAFKKDYDVHYRDFEQRFNAMNEEGKAIAIPEEDLLKLHDKVIEQAIKDVGTDSPHYDTYKKYANRILARGTVGELDKLGTEIGGELRGALRSGNSNEITALSTLKREIRELQESQILGQSKELEKQGVQYGSALGRDVVKERARLKNEYRQFAQMSEDLMNNIGVGKDFHGAKTLERKLATLSPEEILHKFSIKGNAEFIPFLKQHFPETYQAVRNAEVKALLKPAILAAKGEHEINVSKLSDIVKKKMAGEKEYLEALLPPEALKRIQSAEVLQSIIPKPKDSGTPAGMIGALKNMAASPFALIASLTGHNPIVGGIAGHLAGHVGSAAPDAIRLSLLKFAGSEQPVSAGAFKSMVEYMNNSIKGQTALVKGAAAIFKSGAQVLTDKQMPAKADREKLDKLVTKVSTDPNILTNMSKSSTGHYMPEAQTALAETTTRATQYLQQLKSKPMQLSPLDQPIPPSEAAIARYNRALDIANQPNIILDRIKHGTLQISDVQDLKGMYPALYNTMASKVTESMTHMVSAEHSVPYKTKMSLSLFLGQPLDSSMAPMAIMAAQPIPKAPPPEMPKGQPKHSTAALNKQPKAYQTRDQAAESNRNSH